MKLLKIFCQVLSYLPDVLFIIFMLLLTVIDCILELIYRIFLTPYKLIKRLINEYNFLKKQFDKFN